MKPSIASVLLVGGALLRLSVSPVSPADVPITEQHFLTQAKNLLAEGKYAEAKDLLRQGIRQVADPTSLWIEYDRIAQMRPVPIPYRYNSPATTSDIINLFTIIERALKLTRASNADLKILSLDAVGPGEIHFEVSANIFAPFVEALMLPFGTPSIEFNRSEYPAERDLFGISGLSPTEKELISATFYGNRPFIPDRFSTGFDKGLESAIKPPHEQLPSALYVLPPLLGNHPIIGITATADRLPTEALNLLPRPHGMK